MIGWSLHGEREPACGVEGRLTMVVPGESVLALAGVLWESPECVGLRPTAVRGPAGVFGRGERIGRKRSNLRTTAMWLGSFVAVVGGCAWLF